MRPTSRAEAKSRNRVAFSGILTRMVKCLGIGGVLLLLLLGIAAQAQYSRPTQNPETLDRTIDQLRFDTPTWIEGRLLISDTYDEAIWVELTRVFEESHWRSVIHAVQLLMYARDASMMELFRTLPRGTTVRMLIQRGQDGKRRILELEGV